MVTVKNDNDDEDDTTKIEEEDDVEENDTEEFHSEIDEINLVKQTEMIEKCDVKKEIIVSSVPETRTTSSKTITTNTSTTTTTTTMVNHCEDDDDESSSEHELTNLGWLIDLKNLAQWPVDSNASNRKNSNANSHSALVNGITSCIMNDIDDEQHIVAPVISEKDLSEERFKKFTIQVKQ